MGAESTLSRGELVDRYEIRELIGEGGMGAIYRAVDTRLGRSVALKIVRRNLAADLGEPVRRRFLREALALSKVEHRNVVRVIDFGFWRDRPYLAMEHLRGRDLGKLIDESVGFLPVSEIVDVMLGVCAAIRACHDAGVIHRDLKPSNIFLCEGDGGREVKILDFGISKLTTPAAGAELTKDGEIIGTPQFLAPEQLVGKAVPQTDQYAIAVALYQCLTRSLPHQRHANVESVLRAIDIGEITPPTTLRADIPPSLEVVILRAMHAVPTQRFASVHALGQALWEFASPSARERWQSYYFDGRPSAAPNASAHEMPLVEALARGILPEPPGAAGWRGAAPGPVEATRFASPPPPPELPAGLSSQADRPVEATRVASTAAPPVDATRLFPPDHVRAAPRERSSSVSSKSSPGASRTRVRARGRWLPASLLVAGALVVIGVRWWPAHQPASEPRPEPAAPTTTAPVAVPRRTAEQPPPPTRLPPPPVEDSPLPQATSSNVEKPLRRNLRARAAEHTADGIPILP